VFTHLVSAVRWPATVLALLTSLALSSLTYKFLELPIRKIRSGVTVTVWLALFVGIGGMVGLLANRRAIVARLSTPMDQGVEAALDDWKYPFGGNFKAAGRYQAGILKGSNGGQVVFIGDSHMEQYYPRVKLLSSLRGTGDFPTSVFITSEGCPPLPGVNQVSPGYTCDSFFAFASQYAQRPDVRTVVFGAYWEAYFGHRYDARPGELASAQLYRTGDANRDPLVLAAASTEVMFQDFEESMRVLVGQGKDVFVLLSNPTGVAYDPTSMISRLTNTVRRRDVNRDNFVEAVRPVIDRIRMAAVRAGATVIDPLPYLCGGAVCRTTTHDGLPRYLDRDHLRSSYAADAAVFIDQVLEPARATASGN
jgi:hypothetical protein